jgi:hypothetical protein
MRQAAGPLIENLPIVLTGDQKTVVLSLENPSLEDYSVVPLRTFCPSLSWRNEGTWTKGITCSS